MGVTIWTTTDCNLQCEYCYELKSEQRNNLSKKTYMQVSQILEWLKKNDLGKDRIIFHGGEPLLRFSVIKEITESLNEKNRLPQRMGLTTNGTIWNDEIECFFAKYRFLFQEDMSISIDGTEHMHDRFRKTVSGDGSYKKVLATQKKMIKIFPQLRVRMTITPDDLEHLCEGIKSLADLGFQTISADLDYYDQRWSENHMQILKEQVIQIIEFWKSNPHLRLPFVDSIRYRRSKGKCIFSYNIYPNGDIYPCIAVTGVEDFCIGNVIDGFDCKKIEELKEKLSQEYQLCKTCNNKKFCVHNRCKFVNYVLNDSFDLPSFLGCRIENLKLELEQYLSPYINYI